MTAVVCTPDEFLFRRIEHCPTCGGDQRFAVRDAAWYGPTSTCCNCGDSWSEGERRQRPFRRAWRKAAIAAAEQTWEEAGAFDPADYDAWLRAQISEEAS